MKRASGKATGKEGMLALLRTVVGGAHGLVVGRHGIERPLVTNSDVCGSADASRRGSRDGQRYSGKGGNMACALCIGDGTLGGAETGRNKGVAAGGGVWANAGTGLETGHSLLGAWHSSGARAVPAVGSSAGSASGACKPVAVAAHRALN